MRFALGALCAALLLAGCAETGSSSASGAFDQAVLTCPGSPAISTADAGRSLIVNGAGSGDMKAVACVLNQLGASSALVNKIGTTNALMGRQSDDLGGYHYEWSFANNQLDMTITEN